MTVHLTITDEQGKALNWFLGSLTAGVCDDLSLSRIYDRLYEEFGYVEVSGVRRSEAGCWTRKDGEHATVIERPKNVARYIDAT